VDFRTDSTMFNSSRSQTRSRGNIAAPDSIAVRDGYRIQRGGSESIWVSRLDTAIPPPRFDLQKGKLRWGGNWVDHRPIYKPLLACGPPNYNYITISKSSYAEDAKSEIIRFLLALELWESTPGEKFMTAYEIWAKSLLYGPNFAEELSSLFDSLWRMEIEIDSYNFLFPSRFLPRWTEGTDDLSLSKDPTYSDPHVLEEFQIVVAELLDEAKANGEINLPTDAEIEFERSTTTSYIASENLRVPHWEASLSNTKFNDQELRSVRCVVPVYPGGIRDTIIADISANFSVRWIERSMRHILQNIPESAVCLYSSTFEKRLNDVVYTKGYHVLRDIKKCGITYNTHDLFPIVMKELIRITGDVRWKRMNIFNNLYIRDDDIEYKAERGYGLGMANHLVTLCNIAIYRMSLNVTAQKYKNFKVKNITGNDDQDTVIIGINDRSREIAEYLMNAELDVQGQLGNIVHAKKSVIKSFGLFYEQYDRKGWKNKEALVCNALACAYLAPNIRVAKHYIFSQSDRFSNTWAMSQLRALAQFWGPEFYNVEDELYVHFEIGGWLNTSSLGLKTTTRDVYYLAERHKFEMISYAYEACKKFLSPPSPLFKKEEMVKNFRYTGMAKKSDPVVQLYTLGESDLREYYKKLTTFQRRYDKRIENYSSRVFSTSMHKDAESIVKDLLLRSPWYVIPEELAGEELSSGCELIDFQSELYSHSDDLISDSIDGLIEYDDLIFKWDPFIPIKAQERRIAVSIEDLLMASQFSNSGFLPILEFQLKYKATPSISRVYGRLRFPGSPREKFDFFSSLSKKIFKTEKKPKQILPKTFEFWDNGQESEETFEGLNIEELISNERINFNVRFREDIPEEVQEKVEEINFDDILASINSGGAIGTIFSGDHYDYSNYEESEDVHEEEPEAPSMFDDTGDY